MSHLWKFYLRCLRGAAPTHFVLLGIVLALALFIYTPQAPNIDNTVSTVILAFSEAIATPKLLNFEKSDRYDRITCPKFFIYYYLQYPD
ncbi:MAG: hypothetical protein V7K94_07330 [Nostoc sp.]